MHRIPALPLCVVLVAVVAATATDLWKFRVYNVLTVPLLLSGLIYHAAVGGTAGLALSLLGTCAAALPFLPVYVKGGMGAGDLKLLAGIGCWLGPWVALHVVIFSGLITGCCSLAITIWNRRRPAYARSGSNIQSQNQNRPDFFPHNYDSWAVLQLSEAHRRALPFAVMVAIGVMITLLWLGVDN